MKDFNNRNIYITGGSSGIGLAIAKLFATKGANVIIFARDEKKLKNAIAEISKTKQSNNQRISYQQLDITNYEQVNKTISESVFEFGPPDVLINCAGRAIPDYFENISAQQFDTTIDINLKGTWYVTSCLIPHMKSKGGHIVNVSSIAGFIGVFGYTDYSASKFAIIGFSEALKSEMRPYNIKVSVLCPPDTDTPGFEIENTTKPMETKAISENAKLMSPYRVAEGLLKGMQSNKFLIIPGFEGKMAHLAKRYFPGLVNYIMQRDIAKAKGKHA